jgi:DNA-binding transcriptional MerR regulator
MPASSSLPTAGREPRAETFSIAELAEAFGATPRAIRFYEDKGLLAPARAGTTRIYSRRDRARLKLILRGRRLGFSLEDIGEMLDLYDLEDGKAEQLRVIRRKAKARLAELKAQRRDIDEAIGELEDGLRQVERLLEAKRPGAAAA